MVQGNLTKRHNADFNQGCRDLVRFCRACDATSEWFCQFVMQLPQWCLCKLPVTLLDYNSVTSCCASCDVVVQCDAVQVVIHLQLSAVHSVRQFKFNAVQVVSCDAIIVSFRSRCDASTVWCCASCDALSVYAVMQLHCEAVEVVMLL